MKVFIVADEMLVPGERTFCGHRLLNDGVALLLESKQDLLRKRARLAKRDEIGATFALQVRKHSARMKASDEMVWALRVRHGRNAGVLACEFRRRPAASWNVGIHRCLCSLHRDGAGTRSRGRLRYAATAAGRGRH